MQCIAANLDVPDIDQAVAFYRDNLDFAEGLRIPDADGRPRHATVWNGEATIMFERLEHVPPERRPYLGSGVTLYIALDPDEDVDTLYSKAGRRGLNIVKPLRDEYWGARAFTLADLNGYHITFAQQIAELTPQQMIENLQRQL